MAITPILGLPYPTQDDTVDVPRDVQALAVALDPLGVVPVGAFMMWLTAIAPMNWLFMNGQQVDATLYPKLATLLGQVGGLVTIPDMRDRFPVAAGATMALGTTGGAASVTLTDRQSGMRAHNHGSLTSGADRDLNHLHGIGAGAVNLTGGGGIWMRQVENADAQATTTKTGGAVDHLHIIGTEAAQPALDAHENRPPFRAVNFIIRAG